MQDALIALIDEVTLMKEEQKPLMTAATALQEKEMSLQNENMSL
jgi:hypothetical protein